MRVNLNKWPKYPATRAVDFSRLDGGLNLRELNYRLESNQSPNMKNLWWRDGALQSRDGQRYITEPTGDDGAAETGYALAPEPFYGHAVWHAGARLYCAPLADLDNAASGGMLSPRVLWEGVPENAGTFFRYDGSLFYKNRGGYFRIDCDSALSLSLSASDAAAEAPVPVILLNADPETGGGDLYQPENRLCAEKTVWYTAKEDVTEYKLPVTDIDAVTGVTVDGVALTPGTDYSVNLSVGAVTFANAPPVTDPETANTVRIRYAKANPTAYSAVMSCARAITAGDGGNLCVVLGGCEAQPNAVFWNANDAYAMHPAYFPMENYNLCGESGDAVTGFGLQYGELIVFQSRSIGKMPFEVVSLEGRDTISFGYKLINAAVGCDRPGSIQLIENNLVFASLERGVCILRSASAALENNVACLSADVNGDGKRGLLADLRAAEAAVSADDRGHYWLCANGHAWVWDYENSGDGGRAAVRDESGDVVDVTDARPSWYYFTEIRPKSFLVDGRGRLYHLDAAGRLTLFERSFSDYGGAIDKVYTFVTEFFGGYENRKDVLYLLLSVRSDTDTEVRLRYDTDFERRVDLTPVRTWAWRLTPRNLARRCLASCRFSFVARRDPKCRGVRHFSLTLSNNTAGEDLAIVSLRVFYRLQGRER